MNNGPAVFFSYTRADDERENRRLSRMRNALQTELCVLSGDEWTVFQDIEHIEIGEQWRKRLAEEVGGSTFFLPILTPTYLKRPVCRDELSQFLKKEAELGRDDLVFPVLYLDTPVLTDKNLREADPLAIALAARTWDDWRELRTFRLDTAKVRRRLTILAQAILSANKRDHPHPTQELIAPATVNPPVASVLDPSLDWKERVRSAIRIASTVVPLTAMLSQWMSEIMFHGLPQPNLLAYPLTRYGSRAEHLIDQLYSLVRAQDYATTVIEWTPALDPFRRELRYFAANGFLEGRHTITAESAKGYGSTTRAF